MSHFGHSHRSSNFFIVFVRVICVWSVISDGTIAKNTYNLLKAQIMVSILLAIKFLFLPFFFLAAPAACGSSWARDRTRATAVTTLGP